jgi:putative two-component system response regulator
VVIIYKINNVEINMLTETKETILIVDDVAENLHILSELLMPSYRVLVATSGLSALRIVEAAPKPDLILLDVMMPEVDGYTVLSQIKQNPATQDIPVIFVTALSESDDEEKGLRLGAVDYIAKPIKPAVVLARVRTQLDVKRAREWLKSENDLLEAEVAKRMAENDLTQQVSIRALAHLAEIRDPETGNHLRRTQNYVHCLASGLKQRPKYTALMTDRYIDLLARSAPLHDIGKVGIPDYILLKPGKLTEEEFTIMKTHAKLGSDAIQKAEDEMSMPLPFLLIAKEIAHWHHEKWDGSGYPDALAGQDIPLSARIMALADVYDALTSARPYKVAMTSEAARDIIVAGKGKHFDPTLVEVFLENLDEFVAIGNRFADVDSGVALN